MNFTDKECHTYERRRDAPKSNRFHACHALMRLRTSATSQIIGKQWFSVEKALRAGLSANRKLSRNGLGGVGAEFSSTPLCPRLPLDTNRALYLQRGRSFGTKELWPDWPEQNAGL